MAYVASYLGNAPTTLRPYITHSAKNTSFQHYRVFPAVLYIVLTLHNKVQWRKVKPCRFSSAKLFCPCMFAHLLRLGKGTAKLCTCCAPAGEECNKYDLIAAPCFWLVNHNDSSRWFAVSSLPTYLQFQFFYWWSWKKSK